MADIVVFGRTGQVATELARQADVVALGRDVADLSDPAACAAAILERRPRLVINAAAYTAVDRAEHAPALAHVINADAPGAMARACADLGVPFLHISTDYVFDGTGTAPWRAADTPAPQNVYGHTKLAGEGAVAAAAGQWAVMRTAWVFSAHGTNFVNTMLRLSKARDHLDVVSDQVGCPTPAKDIAAALLRMGAAMEAGQPGGIYHFGGQPAVSWADFARAIFARAHAAMTIRDIPTSAYPTPAARPMNGRLDCCALETDFGIPAPDWRPGLETVLREVGAI